MEGDDLLQEALDFLISMSDSEEGLDASIDATTISSCSLSIPGNKSYKTKKTAKAVKVARKPKVQQRLLQVGEQSWVATIPHSVSTFDRTNFLMYFPTIIHKHVNSGDLGGLRQVLKSRSVKNLEFLAPKQDSPLFGVSHIIKFYELILAYHPDAISMVTSLTICGNEICSAFSFKGTDSVMLNKELSSTASSTQIANFFKSSRGSITERMDMENKTAEDLERIKFLQKSDLDLTVYGAGVMRLAFDDQKKIKRFEVSCRYVDLKLAENWRA